MRIRSLITFGFLLAASGASLTAATVLFTIGPDNDFVPRSFTSISVDASSVTSLFNLGDGSLGFNGGLTFRPTDGLFYAIANDGSGNSTLQSFSLAGAGTLASVFALESGFLSGLTYDSADGNLYAIADDMVSGHSFFDRLNLGSSSVTPVADLGLGFEGGGLFTGGLTFNPNDGLFYAMSADGGGVSRVFNSISPGGVVTPLFSLGDGSLAFNGGLLFNRDDGRFYAISNDGLGNSTLNSFALGGGGAFDTAFALGQGFNNVGLTAIPSVPEPSTAVFFATAMAGLAALQRLLRHRNSSRPGRWVACQGGSHVVRRRS